MTALFPGSFDPPHLGHLDVIERGAKLFDMLYVGVAETHTALLPPEDRITLLKQATNHLPNVKIVSYQGLTVDCARELGVTNLVRGLRTEADCMHEFQMASANRRVDHIETIFLLAKADHTRISSSLIREIGPSGRDLSPFLPPSIELAVRKALAN